MRLHAKPLLALVLLAGCSFPHTVRTVGKGKTALNVSLGGPLINNLGFPVMIPAMTAGAQYGITDYLDVHGNFHLLPTIFATPGLDFGSTIRILKQKKAVPELTATLRLSLLTNFDAFRCYPELEAYASYLFKKQWLVFLGFTTLYDFFWPRGNKFRLHWGPTLGAEFRFKKHYAVGLAFRWISPERDTGILAVEYVSPGHLGQFGILLGFKVNFKGWEGLK